MLNRWQSTIVDERGNVQPLANLTVRLESDQSLAKMWASPSTSQPLPDGMVQADGNGYAYFYAPAGLYRIQSNDLNIDWRHVDIGAAVATMIAQQALDNALPTYETLAEMQADTSQPVDTMARVVDDPAEGTNGFYLWDGAAWNRTSLQPASAEGVDAAITAAAEAQQSAIEAADSADSVQIKEQEREQIFEDAQDERENRFNDFIASSGYQFLGDYAAGIEITEYNQIVRDSDGEFWRLSGQIDLPYTTTGAGLPEDDALTPLGDAVLRQDIALGEASVFSSSGSEPIKDALNRRPISVNNINELMAIDRTYLEDGQAFAVARNGTYIWNAAQGEFKLASTPSRTSFVDKLKDSSNCMGMFYNPTSSGDSFALGWTFRGGNGVRASASIPFIEDAAGWIRPSAVLEGPTSSGGVSIGGRFDINFQGTKASANNSTYTTTVGDTFTAVVTGESVRFYSYADPRGGVWRITVDGRPRDISVWRPSAGFVYQDVIDGLDPNITHIVTGEFIGEDPNNAPSSGSARGWFWYADEQGEFSNEARAISNQIKDSLGAPTPTSSLQDVGIREFAMRVFEVGQDASTSSWIPSHDNQIISVGPVEKRISIDGKEISWTSLPSRMKVHSRVVIEQTFEFKHVSGTSALGRLTTRHTFNNDGTVNFDYRITALRDFNVDIWYGANFSPDGTSGWANELVLNNGTRIDLSNYSSGNLEEYAVTSAAYLGQSSNGWYQGIAIDVDLPEMLATSVYPYQSRSPMNIAATRKLYWLTSTDGGMTMKAGESYSANIRWGYFLGIQSPNELGGEKSLI